jgi:hypothetical protein
VYVDGNDESPDVNDSFDIRVRKCREVDGRKALTDDEREKGKTKSCDEPEEASIGAGHVLEEMRVEEAEVGKEAQVSSEEEERKGDNARLLRRRQAPPRTVPPVRPQLGEASQSRHAHRGESEQHPCRLPLPIPLIALPWLPRTCSPSEAIEVVAVEEETDREGKSPEGEIGDRAAEGGRPPIEAVCEGKRRQSKLGE